jgi:single-strand DNA-binding protein
MAGETLVTVVGNLTADVELRYPAAGIPVAGFTVASTPKVFDRDRNEFVGGEPLFLRCSLWRQAGENAAQSLSKGMRVIVQGRLKQRTYDDKEGQRRTVVAIDAQEVAASLTYATAAITKTYRAGVPSQGGPAPAAQQASNTTQPPSNQAPAESHPF